MALVRFQDLAAAGALTGTEIVPITQAGVDVKTTTQNIADLGTGGSSGLTITSKSTDYTFVLGDANNGFLHPSADTTARNWTIPANGSVAYPVGTQLVGFNQDAAGVISVLITTDTMRLAGAGTTGTRTLAANGYFVVTKLASTEWQIAGVGLT